MAKTFKTVGITITIPEKARETIDRQARERGVGSSLWANQIFDMGFAAVCAREKSLPATDADLDAIVGAAGLLFYGERWDTARIAAGLGISEAVVDRILAGWKTYRRGQG